MKFPIANYLRWKGFVVKEMNWNSLEKICGYMVVLCIIIKSLEKFHITDQSTKTANIFHL